MQPIGMSSSSVNKNSQEHVNLKCFCQSSLACMRSQICKLFHQFKPAAVDQLQMPVLIAQLA